jgi:hypothetical protein
MKRNNAPVAGHTITVYSSALLSTGNAFQDLPRLGETADNTERYI